MISLSDNEAWRRLRLTPLLSSSKFSALKCLQNSSIIQNNSEVSLNEVKNFVTGSHIKYFCNCLTFTCKNTKHLLDYQLFCWLSLITNWGSIWNRVCKYSWKNKRVFCDWRKAFAGDSIFLSMSDWFSLRQARHPSHSFAGHDLRIAPSQILQYNSKKEARLPKLLLEH